MNKRIKQLAIWAGASECGDKFITATIDIEKFARLIIEDCVGAAEEAQADSYVVNRIYRQFEEKRLYKLEEPGYNLSSGCK